jgi:hypothetical protein
MPYYTYNPYLAKHLIYKKSIRFQREEGSLIKCFAYILNLICKDILKELEANTHKQATKFLDRVAKKR